MADTTCTRDEKQASESEDKEWKNKLATTAIETITKYIGELIARKPELKDNAKVYSMYSEALTSAARLGHINTVETLLAISIGVDCEDKETWTPLIIASSKGDTEMVKMLLGHGADINHVTTKKDTSGDGTDALCQATAGNHLQTMKVLIQEGANLNSTNKLSWSPILVAVENFHVDSVRLLLSSGVDLSGFTGAIALSEAARYNEKTIVELLIEFGVDLNYEFCENKYNLHPPLTAATREYNTEMVQVLLQHGFQVDKTYDYFPGTALIEAIDFGNFETAQLLLNWGADVNAVTPDGNDFYTALHYAAFRETVPEFKHELLSLLLLSGANVKFQQVLSSHPDIKIVKEDGVDEYRREGGKLGWKFKINETDIKSGLEEMYDAGLVTKE